MLNLTCRVKNAHSYEATFHARPRARVGQPVEKTEARSEMVGEQEHHEQRQPVAARSRRHDAAMHERDIRGGEIERGKRLIQFGDEGGDLTGVVMFETLPHGLSYRLRQSLGMDRGGRAVVVLHLAVATTPDCSPTMKVFEVPSLISVNLYVLLSMKTPLGRDDVAPVVSTIGPMPLLPA